MIIGKPVYGAALLVVALSLLCELWVPGADYVIGIAAVLSGLATWVVPNTLIQSALGHLPFGALATGTTSLALLDLDEHRLYADNRRSQVDMRVAKLFHFGSRRLDAGFDIGNLFNTNYATGYDNTYQYTVGNTAQGGTWNNPTNVVNARFLRWNLTVDF